MVRRSLKRRNIRGGAEADAAKAKAKAEAEDAEPALEKFKEHCEDISDLITGATEIYLWVIDMQHDFIDDDFEDQTVLTKKEIKSTDIKLGIDISIESLNQTLKVRVDGGGIKKVEQRLNNAWGKLRDENSKQPIHKGRFAVDEGLQCIKDIGHYIKLLTENTDDEINSKLKQIIFSRDLHTRNNDNIEDPNHCSFSVSGADKKGKIDGIGFPAHCVNGTVGCKLHPNIWNMVTELEKKTKKSMVVIKGCRHNVDSFGAVPYSCKRDAKRHVKLYTKSRQHNGCNAECSDDNDLPETGSYVLEKKPEGQDNRNDKLISNLEDIKKDGNKVEEKLNLDNSKEGVLHLVCGLAGDYCVRDTAINLKFKYPNHKVAVIADAVRYPSLSPDVIQTDADNLKKNLHLNSHIDDNDGGEHFFLTAPDTLLYTYSPKFFGSEARMPRPRAPRDEGVLFTMDEERKVNINYIKPPKSGRERVTPIRDSTNKYWCLSRHMYLLGKQLELCDKYTDRKSTRLNSSH